MMNNNKNYKNRAIFSKIWQEIDNDKIILLNGARQVGKTTLMKMVKEKLISEKNVSQDRILWFDLERTGDLADWDKQIDALNVLPVKDVSNKYYLFIDEFQRASEIGSTLKVIHDHYPHIKPIVTGSASWYLNIDESMAGRKTVIKILPLSFQEFLRWKQDDEVARRASMLAENKRLPSAFVDIANNALLDFLAFGGYPETVLAEGESTRRQILNDLINSYLTRDIKIWNYAANTLQIKKLLSLLAAQTGGLLNQQILSINTELGRTALQNRLELLRNTFILYFIQPYFTNKIKEIAKNPKIYLADTGLRNALLDNFSIMPQTPEFGKMTENFVVMELLKNPDNAFTMDGGVNFWRTRQKQEVDIILRRENKLIPIEVKGGNCLKIPSGLKSFIRQYQPETAYVLNWSIIKDEQYKNCQVLFRPLWFADKI